MPDHWVLLRICEEGLASSLLDAMQQPLDLAVRVIDEKVFAKAWELVKRTENEDQLPDSPMIDLVFEIQADRLRARKAARSGD